MGLQLNEQKNLFKLIPSLTPHPIPFQKNSLLPNPPKPKTF